MYSESGQQASAPGPSTNWVSAWYAAPVQMLPANLSGRTLRQIIHLHAGGEHIRLHLSHRYGDEPITLHSVSIGKVLNGPTVQAGEQVVLFAGQTTITLQPGQEVTSDPVTLRVKMFSNLAITFFLAQGECTTGHASALQSSYVSATGDVTTASAETAFQLYPLITPSWWLITGIDVLPTSPLNAVVAIGSSVTDGNGSTPEMNRRWPDYLARRLLNAGGARFMSVLNAGISGNQLTSSEPFRFTETGRPYFLSGEAGSKRLAWDALTQQGATDLIVHLGSNDLRLGVAGETVIHALQQLARQARKMYQRVFAATILPGGYTSMQIKQRQIVNTWMLEQSEQWFDAVFDFATPLRSPEDEALLHPAYDSGDGVHPNDEGYQRMAAAVDICQLTGSPDFPSDPEINYNHL